MRKNSGIELSDILKKEQNTLTTRYSLHSVQRRSLYNLTTCRTSAQGGHLLKCDHCAHQKPAYNSCRDRHCPKCQFLKQEVWVDKVSTRLLPGRYFHIVFTLPPDLHAMFYSNQRACYRILMQCASKTVLQGTSNPQFLGAETGCLTILHTWGQTLTYHPHVHLLCPAGGLSEDGMEWIPSSKNFLVPVKALQKMFRAMVMKEVKEGIVRDTINYDMSEFYKIKEQLYSKPWHVYLKKGFRGANAVLKYLGRYTHRVAFSNSRFISIEDDKVTFRYKDYRDRNRTKSMTLSTLEFSRRFLQHILPIGFYKIRYSGLFANIHQKGKLAQARTLLALPSHDSRYDGLDSLEVLRMITGRNITKCPKCKNGTLMAVPLNTQME